MDAAEEGNLNQLKLLLSQGRSIDERDARVKFGWTPLIAAIYQGNTNVVHFLIASGADVNISDNNGETPLMWAISKGDQNLEVVNDLIAHGADLSAQNKMGVTALSAAGSQPPKPKLVEAIKAALANQERKK